MPAKLLPLTPAPAPFSSFPLNLLAKCHKQSWYYSIGLTIALGFNQIQNQLSNLLHLPSQVGEQESEREMVVGVAGS